MSNYIRSVRPPPLQINGHLQTIIPALFRRVDLDYHRERISTPDGDFLDLDWTHGNHSNLLIICHGLEGSSSRAYVKGMAKYFHKNHWKVLTWNYRGCSEEMNRKLRFYHSGATDDLNTVLNHAISNYSFSKIHLLGFSLGGNLILKYLGEKELDVHKSISKAIGLSVPIDLYASCMKLSRGVNQIYSKRFLKQLKKKVRKKSIAFPDKFDLSLLNKIRTLFDFDDAFTAPVHGFDSALDYYSKCSAKQFLPNIKIPTLLINAKNDPFLASSCYPKKEIRAHSYLELLLPENGGHCGFADRRFSNEYWSEIVALEFMNR